MTDLELTGSFSDSSLIGNIFYSPAYTYILYSLHILVNEGYSLIPDLHTNIVTIVMAQPQPVKNSGQVLFSNSVQDFSYLMDDGRL